MSYEATVRWLRGINSFLDARMELVAACAHVALAPKPGTDNPQAG